VIVKFASVKKVVLAIVVIVKLQTKKKRETKLLSLFL